MEWFERFKGRTHQWGKTPQEQLSNRIKDSFEALLKQGVSTVVSIDGITIPAVILSLSDSEITEEKFLLIEKGHEEICKVGAIVGWNGGQHLILNYFPSFAEDTLAPYYKFAFSRAVTTYSWQTPKGQVRTVPVVVKRMTDFLDDRVRQKLPMTQSGGTLAVVLPAIKAFKKEERLILNGRPYKVSGLDDFQPGIVYLFLEDDLLVSTDNLELGVANYVPVNSKFKLFFLGEPSVLSFAPGATVKLHPTLLEDGNAVPTIPSQFKWTTSNPNVVEIDSLTGEIRVKSTALTSETSTIAATLKENEVLTTSVTIEVEATPAIVEAYSLVGPDSIRMRQHGFYKLHYSKNGVDLPIEGDYEFVVSSGLEFVSLERGVEDVDVVKLTGVKPGNVILSVVKNGIEVASKAVSVRALWA